MCEYSTYQVARKAGIHTNTVRLYESWGYISKVPRKENGYRKFSKIHMEQVLLVRKLLLFTWISGDIRDVALLVIRFAAVKNFSDAINRNYHLQQIIKNELRKAKEAIRIVEQWNKRKEKEKSSFCFHISEAAKRVGISPDTLRHWERNRLIQIPRNTANGYRLIGTDELERLKVIRVLRQSGYSIMSILRMVYALDSMKEVSIRKLLDTPSQYEDVLFATDKWMTKLKELYRITEELVLRLDKLQKKAI